MNHEKLSLRLTKVANEVPKGSRLADIGSDHAYLPCYLMLKNHIHYAVAGEVVQGPYESACQQVAQLGLTDRIHVRLADGLAAVMPHDAIDTVTICGMGGDLIARIMADGLANPAVTTVKRWILQPNVGEYTLRKWLVANHFAIEKEIIIVENKRFYEIIVAIPHAKNLVYTEKQLRFGVFLPQQRSGAFVQKWQSELQKYRHILAQLGHAKHETGDKVEQTHAVIREIEEVLADVTTNS